MTVASNFKNSVRVFSIFLVDGLLRQQKRLITYSQNAKGTDSDEGNLQCSSLKKQQCKKAFIPNIWGGQLEEVSLYNQKAKLNF